ncbi:DUF4097 family beta strand repeat-containing protein [Kitasatospora sp. NPDC088346]|uniref:DUF4097 family beta strand repeat-containing protein n=1 Tax=Kitasatospora sp. NPDC088346 TaxID=3364073 RepID=UPI003824382F
MAQWTIGEPDEIGFDETVRTLHVRLVGGAVKVVATDGPALLEVTEVSGEPLLVTLEDGVLTVAYKDLGWHDFGETVKSVQSVKEFFGSLRRGRRAEVTLAVPAGTEVKVGTVSAEATVSGISGGVGAHSASGGATLVGLTGRVLANTVSGDVTAQRVAGELKVNTVSGAITLVAGAAERILANSVSGAVTLDLDVATPTDIKVTTVSGQVGVRLPSVADAKVEAGSTSGDVSSTFEELKVTGGWGAKRLSGQLGSGTGKLQVTSVSGPVTVLRRPEGEDDRPEPVKELPTGPDLTKEV